MTMRGVYADLKIDFLTYHVHAQRGPGTVQKYPLRGRLAAQFWRGDWKIRAYPHTNRSLGLSLGGRYDESLVEGDGRAAGAATCPGTPTSGSPFRFSADAADG